MRAYLAITTVLVLAAVVPAHADWSGRIDASGATFAYPLMDLWRVEYGQVEPGVDLNYNSIGSGGGVRSHLERLGQFAATEAPLNDAEAAAAPNTVTIPAMMGAIVIAYNVDGVPSGLNLTAEAVCGIFIGDIISWDDPLISDANPGASLPDTSIVTVHRSDGSGTTFAFTSYLAKTCPAWDAAIGAAKSVQWPVGVGLPGNEGVAGGIRTTDNSVGYITLAYALQTNIQVANVRNGDDTAFIHPTIQTASAASDALASELPSATESWLDVDLLAAPGDNSYPITSFSYIIMHQDLEESAGDIDQARAVIQMVIWMLTSGQHFAPDLGYVPIASAISDIGLAGLSTVTYGGEPLYAGPGPDIDSRLTVADAPGAVPSWVKNTAGWWAAGDISDAEFAAAIRYLMSEGVIVVEAAPGEGDGTVIIPLWVKNTAGWWAAGDIPDDSFLNALKFLIKNGVIVP